MSSLSETNGGTTPSATARQAAETVVQSVQDAFNRRDPEALAAAFTDDATWTTVFGRRLDGRAAIAEFGREALPRMGDQYARYAVVRLLAVRPDVLVVNVAQTPTTASGEPADGVPGAALYLLTDGPAGWRIAAGQNTFVGAPPR